MIQFPTHVETPPQADAPPHSVSLAEDKRFSRDEFLKRWAAARRSALIRVLAERDHESVDPEISASFSEDKLWEQLHATDQDAALKQVFLHSRKLGQSAVQHYQLQWELSDLHQVLKGSYIPCTMGQWKKNEQAWVATQTYCSAPRIYGNFICNYWREAIDGLIMGVGENERIARHSSMGHGDEICLDVYFEDAPTKEPGGLRWGAIPDNMVSPLEDIKEWLSSQGVTLHWHGYAENTIFYSMSLPDKPICGSTAAIWHNRLYKKVHTEFPDVRMQDAAPLAVYAEGTK